MKYKDGVSTNLIRLYQGQSQQIVSNIVLLQCYQHNNHYYFSSSQHKWKHNVQYVSSLHAKYVIINIIITWVRIFNVVLFQVTKLHGM